MNIFIRWRGALSIIFAFVITGCSKEAQIIQNTTSPDGRATAIIEKVEHPVGLNTSEVDRIRIVATDRSCPDQIIFAEDSVSPAEWPVVAWTGHSLVITFSRDAQVLFREQKWRDIPIKYFRRPELSGRPPIGPLILAVQDPNRIWSNEDITAKIFETCREEKNTATIAAEVNCWEELLHDGRTLRTDSTLKPGIKVDEIALLCVEQLTKNARLVSKCNRMQVRELIATGRGDKPEIFKIRVLKDADMREIEAILDRNRASQP